MLKPTCVSGAVCFLFTCLAHFSPAQARTPETGSEDRKELMDALRGPCERDLKQKVIFKVERLEVVGNWAIARVTPLRPDSQPINYSKTKYRTLVEEGAFDAMGEALLKQKNGRWSVVEWRFGATDTEVDLWRTKHRLPAALLQ